MVPQINKNVIRNTSTSSEEDEDQNLNNYSIPMAKQSIKQKTTQKIAKPHGEYWVYRIYDIKFEV